MAKLYFGTKKQNSYSAANYKQKARLGRVFVTPALILIAIFLVLPALLALYYSFFNYHLLKPQAMKFIGLQNYIQIFQNPTFQQSLKNTFYFVIIVVPIQCGLALLLATLVNKKTKVSTFSRVAFFSPVITSIVVVSILWTILLNQNDGLINSFLGLFGIPPQPFLLSDKQAMNSIILMSVWQAVGYQMMIFLAGLQEIPEALYEAASIDGAGKFRQFISITLPSLRGTTNFVVLITTIQAFKLFTQPYVMTGGGPNGSTSTLALMIYQQGSVNRSVGYSSAISVIFFIIILVVSLLLQNTLLKDKKGV